MGREIVYCASCGRQLSGADAEQAVRRDAQILCRGCAPPTPPPTQISASFRRPGSSTRLTRERRETSPSRSLVFAAVGGAAAVLVLVLSLRSSSPRPPAADPTPVASPAPPSPPKPDRAREEFQSDLARFVDEACAREDFGRAIALWEAARDRFGGPAWASAVENGVRDVRRRAETRADALLASTAAEDRAALAARFASWGVPDLTLALTERIRAAAPPALRLSGPTVKSGKTYPWYAPKPGERIYIDRPYTLTSLPEALRNARALRTSNNDKTATDADFLSFEADVPVAVYVTCDPRKSPPAWMAGWTPAGVSIGMSERDLPLFRKDFAAGRVEIGGSDAPKENALLVFVLPRP